MERDPLGLGTPLEQRPDPFRKPDRARRGSPRLEKSLRPAAPQLDDEAFRGDPPRVGVPLHAYLAEVHPWNLTQGSPRRRFLCSPIRLLHSASATRTARRKCITLVCRWWSSSNDFAEVPGPRFVASRPMKRGAIARAPSRLPSVRAGPRPGTNP